MSRKLWGRLAAVLGLIVLILDHNTAMNGAKAGIDLCIRSVIPSLFPFLYLSGIITKNLSHNALGSNKQADKRMLLFNGYLAGYPIGAQSVSQTYRAKKIGSNELTQLLICCNNPGPAFLFGIVSFSFNQKRLLWVLWGIHIGCSILLYCLIRPDAHKDHAIKDTATNERIHSPQLLIAIRNMAQICGWIILFRVLISILEYRWLGWMPRTWYITISGLLELTNGCMLLNEIECIGLRFCICALFISFGGGCTLIQTHSVTGGLYTGNYLLGKITEGCYSFLLAYLYQFFFFPHLHRFRSPILLLGLISFAAIFSTKTIRKNGRNLSIDSV